MHRISIVGLLLGLFLSGCVYLQQFNQAPPTPTQMIESTNTLTPALSPSVTPLVAHSPSATDVVALEPKDTATPKLSLPATPTPLETENADADAPALAGPQRFVIQTGSPKWLPNFSHPEVGCNFLGVGGQVFELDGDPLEMIVIEAGGTLEGREVLALSLTGNVSVYGPGGYEVILADHVIESQDSVWIQVFNLKGEKLTERVYFDTFADCQRNLGLINFVESGFYAAQSVIHFPLVYK